MPSLIDMFGPGVAGRSTPSTATPVAHVPLTEGMDFTDLLADVMSAKADAEAAKGKRKVLARADAAGLSQAERDRLRAEILAWEAVAEFESEALVAAVEVDQCACGDVSAHFIGLYVLQQCKQRAGDRRLTLWTPQAITPEIAQLPRFHHESRREVPFCSACLHTTGFSSPYTGDLQP